MRLLSISKILGIMLMVLSITQLPPIIVAMIYKDGGIISFTLGFVIIYFFGFILWFFTRKASSELTTRDGFLVVTLLWLVLSIFSTIPILMTLYPYVSITDAIFETVSGLTTTGATVLSKLEHLPHAILYYRQQLQFLGGIGVIVLAVAVMPMLGVGGMRLYRAEVTGPMQSDKLTPRLAGTAKALWSIYVGFTVIAIFSFRVAGMDWFDTVAASFSVVSTGGFFVHDGGFAYYHSTAIDVIGTVFMLLGGTNFALHFKLFHQRSPLVYFKDPEFRFYISNYFIAILVVFIVLSYFDVYHLGRNLLNAAFTVISLGTTTGLSTTNFDLWPIFLPYLVMFVALIGGCAGSTSGGIKVIRALVLREQTRREFYRLIHPKGVFSVKIGNQKVSEKTVQGIFGFVTVFTILFIFLLLLLLATGLNFKTSFGALTATITNAGAGIGDVFNAFGGLSNFAKWVCIFSMILGRLEIFTVIVLFLPSYWR